MKKKTIISLFSTLVFIFPLIYQPIHVILYHADHHEEKDGYSNEVENCLVYEYQFASFDLPTEVNLTLESNKSHSTLNSFYKKSKIGIKLLNSSSRGPPTFS